MSPRQKKILAYVAKNPGCTRHQAMKALSIPKTTLNRNMGLLCKQGLVQRKLETVTKPHRGASYFYSVTPLGEQALQKEPLDE